jgi:nucleoid DNA-binding protein
MDVKKERINLKSVVTGLVDERNRGLGVSSHTRKADIEEKTDFTFSVFDKILSLVSSECVVGITGFGSFSPRITKSEARNPQTEEVVEVKDRVRLRFVASVKSVRKLNDK